VSAGLDTSVVVRLLVGEPADQAELAWRFLAECEANGGAAQVSSRQPRDPGDHCLELADRAGDARHLAAHPLDGQAHAAQLPGDVGCGLGGLRRQLLDLPRDDGEAAAGLPRAGGFDVGVERQQIRLPRDVADEADHAIDARGGP
jgi:hypothetical protein